MSAAGMFLGHLRFPLCILPASVYGPGAGLPMLLADVACDNSTLASLADCTLEYGRGDCGNRSGAVGLSCMEPHAPGLEQSPARVGAAADGGA
ncbi:hypothetical protein ABPG75_012701 [Micractinium tetrahymenae]